MKTIMMVLVIATVSMANTLADRLIELRAEVDSLQNQIQAERLSLTKEMASLSVQKGDLKASIDKENLRIGEVRKTIREYQSQLKVEANHNEELEPLLMIGIANLAAYMDQAMPFQSEHRSSELDKLKKQLESGSIPLSQAMSRLWSLYEDEFRLAQDSGLHRQVLEINGSDELVDVIHLGMFAMYFRTADGRLGMIHRKMSGWTTVLITESGARREMRNLFDSFEKKVRVGRFDLPSPFVGASL